MALMPRARTLISRSRFHRTLQNSCLPPSHPSRTQRYQTIATSASNPCPTRRQLSTETPPAPRKPTKRTPYSRNHYEERLVPFTQKQLYEVVSNVNDYKNFVPWCTNSQISRRVDEKHIIADLGVGFTILSENYTSVITLKPNQAVSADVPDSNLFEYLITDWKFEPATTQQTRLSFYVEFAFRNPMYQRVTDLFFEEVVRQMVGAFERQCFVKYRTPESAPGILHRW